MSRIIEIIDEIEAYIGDCKPTAFSQSKVVVNKDELEEMLTDLRHEIPEEVRTYQRIISNQDAILQNAQEEADKKINEANKMQAELVDQHEIMQKAYSSANQVIENANAQAEVIVNDARNEALAIKRSIMKYSDDMLEAIQLILERSIGDAKTRYDGLLNALDADYQTIIENREQLNRNQEQ